MSFRTIGKIGFLFVIIGFLMPIACDQNGFEIAKYMMENEEIFSGILLYILFISAIIGCIIGILLAQKKDVSTSSQWAVIIICIMSGLIVYFNHLEDLDLQSGAHMILTGWIISLISQFFPDSNSNKHYSSNKKCRQCGNVYSGSSSSCPKCNFSLYEETNQSVGNTWTCKKCNEVNQITASSCKSCGEYN